MDGEIFFRQQARECREAAASGDVGQSRALLQLAKHYEKEARTASGEGLRPGPRNGELNRY
jgi:thiamine monophosphate kinase